MKRMIITLVFISGATAVQAQKVGVGTKSPDYPFTVKDTLNSGGGIGIAQVSLNGLVAVGTYTDNGNAFIQTHTNNDLCFSTNNGSAQVLLQKGTGNLGIGALSPAEKLEVNGNVKISGTLKLPGGTPAVGKVLTSDASGNAAWATPASGLTLPYLGTDAGSGVTFLVGNTSATGDAIRGQASGSGSGVVGFANGGKAVYGSAGAGRGIEGYSNTGAAGYFSSPSGLALQTGTGGIELNGSVKIVDGTQGAGKVLTSNGSGAASWQTPAASSGFGVKKINNNQTITAGPITKITFSATEAYTLGTAYSVANSEFTAPVNGFYHFDATLSLDNSSGFATSPGSVYIILYRRNATFNPAGGAYYSYEFARTSILASRGFSASVYLDANDIIDLRVLNQSTTPLDVLGSIPAVSTYTFFSGYRVF
jgi:hypothetical protein